MNRRDFITSVTSATVGLVSPPMEVGATPVQSNSRTRKPSQRKLAVSFDEKKIDALFAHLDQRTLPGAAVGIAITGTPVYRKGFGLASMELPVVLSATTRMRIQSTSKHFTCLAYMLLCEDGKAAVDDPIGKYLPELHPVTRSVTMRQLMSHTSGVRDARDIHYMFGSMSREVASADVVALYRDIDDVNFAPGTSWSYCNGGYHMLGMAIERISDKPLAEVMRQRIFEPVGMHDTLLRPLDSDFVPNSATNHMMTAAGAYARPPALGALVGNGGVVSTVNDMLRWLAHMDAPVVGSAATWTQMKTPLTLANGSSTGYGLGLMAQRYRGVGTLGHAGGTLGSNSQMIKVPAAGLDVEVMVNRDDQSGVALANRILDACLVDLDPVEEISAGALVTGTFRSAKTGRVIQLIARDGRQIVSIDASDMPFERGQDGVLRVNSHLKRTVALLGTAEQPTSIRYSDFGNVDELALVERVGGDNSEAIEGCYRSDATRTDAAISITQEGALLVVASPFGSAKFKLQPLAESIWRAETLTHPSTHVLRFGGILTFEDGFRQFRYSDALNRALPFRRRS